MAKWNARATDVTSAPTVDDGAVQLDALEVDGDLASSVMPQLFLSHRSVYLLLFDLRQDLSIASTKHHLPISSSANRDNDEARSELCDLDYLDYWLHWVHAFTASYSTGAAAAASNGATVVGQLSAATLPNADCSTVYTARGAGRTCAQLA